MSNNNMPEIENGTLRAFALSLCQLIGEDPKLLLYMNERIEAKNELLELYQDLQDPKQLQAFSQNVLACLRENDCSEQEKTFWRWGEYGWIADLPGISLDFWNTYPENQVQADKMVLAQFKSRELFELEISLLQKMKFDKTLLEAMLCFEKRFYTASAMIMISLIDAALIKSKPNLLFANRKTGSSAGMRLVQDVSRNDRYGLPGYFHLELLNYESYIKTLFERANGFAGEPGHLNRNYLQHGMNRRRVLRKDCIKLFAAYKKTLELVEA